MDFNRKSKWEFINEFIDFCHKNNIWYSLDNYSLLGLKRHGGFVPWVEKFQVFMKLSSYEKLAKSFPEKVVDSSKDSTIKSYKAFFVKNATNWRTQKDFIEIRILVPTSIHKVLKFRRRLGNIFKKNYDLKSAINNLYEQKYEGFYLLDHKEHKSKLWIANLSFEREKSNFGKIEVQFIKEWNKVLTKQFGPNYMKAFVPTKYYTYEKPLQKQLVES